MVRLTAQGFGAKCESVSNSAKASHKNLMPSRCLERRRTHVVVEISRETKPRLPRKGAPTRHEIDLGPWALGKEEI